MNIKEIIDARFKKIMLMVEANAQKIVRKELKKLQREIIKGMVKK